MKWIDNNVFLNTFYYRVKNKIDYFSLAKSLKMMKIEIDAYAKENGIFITLNNLIIFNENYLLLSILSLDENVEMFKNYINHLIVDEDDIETVKRNTNDFIRLNQKLNNFVVNEKNSTFKEVIEWEKVPEDKKDNDLSFNFKDEFSKDNIKDDTQVFVGSVINIKNPTNPHDMIVMNMIKDGIGGNKVDEAYYNLRKNGAIYHSLTTYFQDSNTILTGCYINYSKESERLVKDEIENVFKRLMDDEKFFNECKLKYVKHFKISNLESHIGYLLEPYSRYLGRECSVEYIKDFINKLSLDDLKKNIENWEFTPLSVSLEDSYDKKN